MTKMVEIDILAEGSESSKTFAFLLTFFLDMVFYSYRQEIRRFKKGLTKNETRS